MERGAEEIYELGELDLREFERIAKKIGEMLEGGETVLLFGDLGSGKTTFVKSMADGLGIDRDYVRSPTFNIVNSYPRLSSRKEDNENPVEVERPGLIHVDLYRVESEEEMLDLALHDLVDLDTVVAVEWPELYVKYVSQPYLIVRLEHCDESTRSVRVEPHGRKMKSLLNRLVTIINEDERREGE